MILDKASGQPQHKITLKLLAVNDEKTKLIGLIHYNFTPNLEDFEAMDNMLIKFQRSIDSDACICISSKLQQ